jgi:hypothetical protein
MKVRIKENSWIARLAAAKLRAAKAAIVFGNTIYLHNTNRLEFLNDHRWVSHELKHIQQYRQHGFATFIFKYLLEWMKKGYYNNRFEVEARMSEKENFNTENITFI